ncbi:MAG: ethylbenzene dehydrogenase-related protein [Thermodesulfobacteriota bacterium]
MVAGALPFLLVILLCPASGLADQTLAAAWTGIPFQVDGEAREPVWRAATAVRTVDKVAGIPMELSAAYNGVDIAILVRFPDEAPDVTHKSWRWNKTLGIYDVGNDREDVFVIKWAMEPADADLSLTADRPYRADVWYWKACRTDPMGFADDKLDVLDTEPARDAVLLTSASGRTMYLHRVEDDGPPAYRPTMPVGFQGEQVPRFVGQVPGGSRSDVRAKGRWQKGFWTVELSRRLDTGQPDDVHLQVGRQARFGVSRFEIAGRKPDPAVDQPLFGCGDISEILTLDFAPLGGTK